MESSLDVVGTGRASAPADTATLDVRVSVDAADVASALDGASRRMAALHDAALGAGVARDGVRTTGAGVHQRWAHDGSGPVGFTAFQTARVVVADLARTGAVVTACAAAAGDAFGLDGLRLSVADPEPLLARAREAAFSDALAKAEHWARLAGRGLGGVVRLTEQAAATLSPTAESATLRTMAVGTADLPVEAGESGVTTTVAVRFAWED